VEHARTERFVLPLEIVRDRALAFKQRAKLCRHRKDAAFAILGGAGIETDLAGREVDLPPLERQHFAVDPPPGDVREHRNGPNRLWQPSQHGLELVRSKKPTRTLCSLSIGMCGFWSSRPD
jgi:hypothetical protein